MCNVKRRLSLFHILSVLVFIASLLAVFCEESLEVEEDDGREGREYLPENWHAVQSIPEGAQGWIPRDPEGGSVVVTKRRRLRKRKRRPPIVTYLDQTAKSVEQANINLRQVINERKEDPALLLEELLPIDPPKRRKRPNAGDPWDELLEDSIRPHTRRKVIPVYRDQTDREIITKPQPNLSYSPLSATIQFAPTSDDLKISQQPKASPPVSFAVETDRLDAVNEEVSYVATSTTTKKTPNLKQILKQNPGLSLSEILQQKNITLSELLMGKKEAIKALTESSSVASTTKYYDFQDFDSTTTERAFNVKNLDNTKYKRLPPSVALRKDSINRRYEQFDSEESLSDREMLEAQKRRQALLKGHEYKNSHLGITRYEVITEPTTEKRIFVPSHPKLYTSMDYKPDLDEITINTEPYVKSETTTTTSMTTPKLTSTTTKARPTTTKNVKPSFTKPKLALPITSAKLLKMVSKKSVSTSTTAKIAATTEEDNYPKMSGPLKPFKINLKDIFGFGISENQPEEKVPDEPLRMHIELEATSEIATPKRTKPSTTMTTTTTQETPKLKPFTAKDEILEILKDPQGRAGLARILEARNMTIQELIEQRERGSSQLHLADIFHNKTREPEPVHEAFEGKISSEVFTSFPLFVRQPKKLSDATAKSPENSVLATVFPSYKIEIKKDTIVNQDSKVWHQLYPELFSSEIIPTSQKPIQVPSIEELISQKVPDILTEEDIQRIDDLSQNLYASLSNENMNTVDETSKKILNIPSGIKSAIVASLAIVVLSMVLFVTILVVFKWSQKRKKLRYVDSLRPPLFEVKQRNIKTFVAETLGQKKVNYYQRHLQSMTDDWETDTENMKNVF